MVIPSVLYKKISFCRYCISKKHNQNQANLTKIIQNQCKLPEQAGPLQVPISNISPMHPGSPTSPLEQPLALVRSPTPQVAAQLVHDPHEVHAESIAQLLWKTQQIFGWSKISIFAGR